MQTPAAKNHAPENKKHKTPKRKTQTENPNTTAAAENIRRQ